MRHRIVLLLIISTWITGCSQKYFIVRHAEKAQGAATLTMNTPNDPALTDLGLRRAKALADRLEKENIRQIFSTRTLRTESTAQPTAILFNQSITTYTAPDSAFISLLKGLHKNVLVVGHSNTVDDLVNGLLGIKQLSDLPDNAYDNLFIVRRKGKKITFSQEKYGPPIQQ